MDWSDYERVHADRRNLRIHLFAVPLFDIAFALGLICFALGDLIPAVVSIPIVIGSMALQKIGHSKESIEPRPFSGPLNFLQRWFSEQFFTFPMFVITGRWMRQYKAGSS